MKNFDSTGLPLLSITSAVRIIEQPINAELQAPDFDEHGFPVMCGSDEFYRVLTNHGQDKIVAMTFEPQSEKDHEQISSKTFFVKITESCSPRDQLLLKQNDAYLICQSDERAKFPEADIFGVIAASAESGGRDNLEIAPLLNETERKRFDEFDQTNRPHKSKRISPHERELEKTKSSRADAETEYDYNADFGA